MKKLDSPRDMQVSPPWVNRIFDGSKRVEVLTNRPNSWGLIKSCDQLKVIHKLTKETRLFRVVEIRIYDSLEECCIAEGVRNILPGCQTIAQAQGVYWHFDGSDLKAVAQRKVDYETFGCIAIELAPDSEEDVLLSVGGRPVLEEI